MLISPSLVITFQLKGLRDVVSIKLYTGQQSHFLKPAKYNFLALETRKATILVTFLINFLWPISSTLFATKTQCSLFTFKSFPHLLPLISWFSRSISITRSSIPACAQTAKVRCAPHTENRGSRDGKVNQQRVPQVNPSLFVIVYWINAWIKSLAKKRRRNLHGTRTGALSSSNIYCYAGWDRCYQVRGVCCYNLELTLCCHITLCTRGVLK